MPTTTKYQSKKSLAPAQWDLKTPWPHCHELAQKLNVPDLVAQLLYNRGITDEIEAEKFLNPSLSDLIEPDRLSGIEPAVKRIQRALEQKQKIVIYGDYDVDGITGVAILWHCLKLAGADVDFYVPHRIDEGYGLNPEAVEKLAQNNTQLIITVDCGITDFAAADVAQKHNVDLIITDHHKIDNSLPHACAIVHPLLENQNYPNKNLCGAAVAFKLAWAIAQQLSGAKKVSPAFRDFLLNATSFAALGTIADVVPLLGENRALAKFGLQGLAHSQNIGIKAIIKAARLEGAKLDSTDIGFQLAPRLNAAGRMGHA
ncbi:MAG: DHH family phosphoesterase, partial [Planctomycetes bacterium]|nr:DHH family phosphoesterase [Planctomycetota bacterium]